MTARTVFFLRVTLACAALGLPACSASEGEPLSRDVEELSQHMSALEAEVAAHAAEIAGAPDMDAVASAEAKHATASHEHKSGMRHEIGDMQACTDGDGHMPATAEMETMLDMMEHECDGHEAAMQTAVDLDAARGEEDRHRAAMDDLFADMQGEAQRMMEADDMMGSDSHMCPDDMHGN